MLIVVNDQDRRRISHQPSPVVPGTSSTRVASCDP
jgi:hypothetical protein